MRAFPPFWRKDQGSDDLTAIAISHKAQAFDHQNPELGIRYTLSATLIKRSSGYVPKFPAMPDLPNAFPARIESAGRYAYLDERGQYQLRMGFTDNNTERFEHTHASPSVERMVPFANAEQELAIGWHFPLLDRSTVLVTLLNNDPNRPCVLGFASELGQDGPVTNRNPNQSRIVTPGQNELTLDDELPRILLQTFDGQTKLELNASGAQPFIALAAQYGLISLSAGQQQRWIVQENLIQKHGGAFIEKVKTNSVVNIEGNRHLQAAKQQTVRAKTDMSFISEGNQHWQTKNLGMSMRSKGAVSIKSRGAQITKISDGNYHVQAPNDITVTGTGKGDLLVSNGTGGFKIDGKGNIKLFGKQITLKGQSGVTFDGDVEYELGSSNEAESANSVEPVEIDDIEALINEDSKTEMITGLRWLSRKSDVSESVTLEFSHQYFEPGAIATVTIFQIINGKETSLTSIEHPLENYEGAERVTWNPESDVTAEHHFLDDKQSLPLTPVLFRFEVDINGTCNTESNLLKLTKWLELTTTGASPSDGEACCYDANETPHYAQLNNRTSHFGSVLLGPIYIELVTTKEV